MGPPSPRRGGEGGPPASNNTSCSTLWTDLTPRGNAPYGVVNSITAVFGFATDGLRRAAARDGG